MTAQPQLKPISNTNLATTFLGTTMHSDSCADQPDAARAKPTHRPEPSTLADAALSYAAMGWSVFPLAPKSKVPLIKDGHGYKDATTDLAVVERWWREHPNANIGLATHGLAILDVDPRNGGDLSLDDFIAQHGPLPNTVESLTGGGGRHIYFRLPDATIRTGTNALAPGLDIKSGGPYVAAPPSIHPNGRTYEWEASSEPGDVEVAPMPEWMVELLSQPVHRTATHHSSTSMVWEVAGVNTSSNRAELDLALARLLGIDQPVGRKFLCLLHDEDHPSAWLFWGKGGDLLYHCEHHGGYTLNIPTLRASVCANRVVHLKGVQHHHHRVIPLLAAGVIQLPLVLHMPLPEDAPEEAKAWYNAFIWAVAFNQLSFPGSLKTPFPRRFAVTLTGLSEKNELAAAKWLMRHQYVQVVGSYKAYGKDCHLLAPGPGPAFEGVVDLDVSDFLEDEERTVAYAAA